MLKEQNLRISLFIYRLITTKRGVNEVKYLLEVRANLAVN